ncbi:L,D-transpeptidase family protein [Flavobacterium restrictum]|uniref:L,D-transpeptidase family protein n=1 Tax=Flavobacterium restrictum TaxID=2594428 RepID=A0A553E3R6_9FLAO|nr:L,D-transpeptidase family protein [Flavobacterium restrictum]TRX39664.1 L,D-transpeptidase family protein [Flavobacterium restrictum]
MTKFCLFIVGCFFLGCQKEVPKTIASYENIAPKTLSKIRVTGNALPIDSLDLALFDSRILTEFYKASGYKTVWQSDTNRKIIVEQLLQSEQEGLNPKDFHVDNLQELEQKHASLTGKELVHYDILLTHNFQKYLIQVNMGKLNPTNLYTDWDLKQPHFDVNAVLSEGFATNSFNGILEKYHPKSVTYNSLIKALALINTYPVDRLKPIIVGQKLVLNDTNSSLIQIKKRLRYWNDLGGKDSLNRVYNKKTFEAVKRFQYRHGLISDGVIGPGTVVALNFTKTQRKEQIIANLERWRWFNQEFNENYILINIPNYSLNVVEKQDTVVFRKVVVGTAKRRTPILTSALKTVVFNPTWTVPPTILKEDVVPAMMRNRNYLKNKSITIYDSNGKEVSPNQWNASKPNNYKYIQSPGMGNSLGVMKILFPNNHSVYLHDTNHRNLFGMHNRSLSSGCVRVENPLELAQQVLNDSEKWSKQRIDSVVATKKTNYVKINKNYAIYLWYWTAWSEKNKLYFRTDIYKLDSELYSKLRN